MQGRSRSSGKRGRLNRRAVEMRGVGVVHGENRILGGDGGTAVVDMIVMMKKRGGEKGGEDGVVLKLQDVLIESTICGS